MEFVEQTESWIENIQHCVHFDSWKQFQQMGHGLNTNWGHLSLLVWGCKQEKSTYWFQIVYMHIYGKRNGKENVLPVFQNHTFELKCVEFPIKDADIPSIREWLITQNPDLWKINILKDKAELTKPKDI